MVQGEINRGRHTDHPAGRHSIGLTSAHLRHPPYFFTGQMPFLPPNQQCQSTEVHGKQVKLLLSSPVGFALTIRWTLHPDSC